MRPRRLVPLDHLILGARPDRLASRKEIEAASVAPPLTTNEQHRLAELTYRMTIERLTPAEEYERRQLSARRFHASR